MPLLRLQGGCNSFKLYSFELVRSLTTRTAPGFTAVAAAAGPPALSRVFSELLLYRDFIQQSLYHSEFGYFNRPSPPIRRLAQPFNFNRLVGQFEYRMELARAYKQLQVDWLTPVEVFAPWYGRALAHYMLELRKHDSSIDSSTPLAIVEIGGGTGTLAASILDYVCEVDPLTYSSMSYTTIEISNSLAAVQQQHILGDRDHSRSWRCVRGDASLPATWQQLAAVLPRHHSSSSSSSSGAAGPGRHTFVLMMEVLDNLPHDRVIRQGPNTPWQQVAVQAAAVQQQQQQEQHQDGSIQQSRSARQRQQQQYSEVLQPADDPLIQRCMQALHLPPSSQSSSSSSSGSNGGGSSGSSGLAAWLQRAFGLEDEQSSLQNNIWLPTRCLQLLETLHVAAPHHTLIAADFDALPDIKVAGQNAPLVSGRGLGGEVQDYGSVLVPWGSADIFFPTDFDGLSSLYAAAAGTVGRGQGGGGGGGVDATAAAAADRTEEEEAAAARQQQQQQCCVSSSHSTTGDFMSAFAEAKHTRTLSGYNPLVQDWQNTRIFVGQAA